MLRLAVVLGGLATLVARGAAAEISTDAPVVIVEPGETCVSGPELSQAVQKELGRELPSGLTVHVSESGFVLLREGQAVAERQFDDLPEICEARREALTLALVVALEHALQEEAEAPLPPPPMVTEEVPAPKEEKGEEKKEADEESPAVPGERPLPNVRLEAGGALLVETLPELAFGGQILASLLFHRASVGLGALVTTQVTSDLGQEHGAIRSRLWAMRGQACWEPTFRLFVFRHCGGVMAGSMTALGSPGVGPQAGMTQKGHSPWLAALLGTGVLIQGRGRFGILASVDAFVHILRPAAEMHVAFVPEETKIVEPALVGVSAALLAFVHLR